MSALPEQLPPYVTPRGVPYLRLECGKPFSLIAPRERLYAHFMATASWHGLGVVATQVSRESRPILQFFLSLLTANTVADLKAAAAKAGASEDELDQLLEFFALTYSNGGNYLSFGDSKFIPALPKATFQSIIAAVPNGDVAALQAMLSSPVAPDHPATLIDIIYDHSDAVQALNFPPKGTTSYYSANIAQKDQVAVDEFLASKSISQYNTRVFKTAESAFVIRLASAEAKEEDPVVFTTSQGEQISIQLVYGDYAPNMARICAALTEAKKYAANDTQVRMIEHYITSFQTGSIEAHRESQKEWVKDMGPVVETNLGFIESYRDPAGVRGEWEGLVAVVDKDQSAKFGALVASGESFIARLPWGIDFEKDVFHSPDFTSLEVVSMCGSGVPLGICIPNYDDIRQDFGFKNVFLGNVGGAMNFSEKLNHLTDDAWELYKTHFVTALSVNVGVHELLGHGTGKLLTESPDGTLNFDREKVIDPFTKKPVATWYKPGETWSSKFGSLSNAYEECRAEAVSLYLGLEHDLLKIFGQNTSEDCHKTIQTMWIHMVRAGLVGLEMYTPESKQWRQAHMRARFCILQVLLRGENSIVKIEHTPLKSLTISVDGDRIATHGKAAIGELLTHLNVHKACADVATGSAYFEKLTEVDEEFVSIRETLMAMRKPRKQFIQAHTRLIEGGADAELVQFDPSVQGVIDAFLARHGADIPL